MDIISQPHYEEINGAMLNAFPPMVGIPIIDIGLLTSPTDGARELENLHSALCSYGCFQVINHGITIEALNHVREITREFFKLPMEEKEKYKANPLEDQFEGYGGDMIEHKESSNDRGDRSYLYLVSIPENSRKLNLWPKNPQDLGKTIEERCSEVHSLSEVLLKSFAKSLELEEKSFLKQLGEERITAARLNYYPPSDRPIMGYKAHSDLTVMTFLLQEKAVGGLQFLRDDQWLACPLPPNPDAILVLAGDQLEIMSNGIFKSPLHRVVTIPNTEKISVVWAILPDETLVIEPVEELVTETRPRLYKKVVFYCHKYVKSYRKGERYLDEVKAV